MRIAVEFDEACALLARGLPPTQVARVTGIPRSTVRDWACAGGVRRFRWFDCRDHDFSSLGYRYAYLLGMYLGDGCISRQRRGVWRLRVTLDAVYPAIVAECEAAMRAVAVGRRANILQRRGRCVEVSSTGSTGRATSLNTARGGNTKRPIILEGWQHAIVEQCIEPFLRGLIHSDGTRIIATERKGQYVGRAPRSGFSNRSEDILGIFQAACERAGVHCTRASKHQIAVYSKSAVARLDEFVGPKS